MIDLEYRNRSISSLVQQLNNLGNQQVLIHQTELIAIQFGQNNQIKRFQSKSSPHRQFFKYKQSDKKYFYNSVISQIDSKTFEDFVKNWQKGYNCTVVLQNSKKYISKLIKSFQPWIKEALVFSILVNKQNEITDVLGKNKITHRQLLENKKYYKIQDKNKANYLIQCLQQAIRNNQTNQESTFIDVSFKHPQLCSQLHLTMFPAQFFQVQCNPPFSLIKSQILQILNYIKINPNKRYQHISKLITKRLPMTNYLTKILMSDTCNLILNWIQSNQKSQPNVNLQGKFQFLKKLSIIGNLLRKADRQSLEIGVPRLAQKLNKSSIRQKNLKTEKSPIEKIKFSTQNDQENENLNSNQNYQHFQKQQNKSQQKQFDFCRSLERKTHKFSISPRQQKNSFEEQRTSAVKDGLDNKKTLSKYQKSNPTFAKNQEAFPEVFNLQNHKPNQFQKQVKYTNSETEIVTLLKAQHARQISQYHQTIQLLNKKIMVLTKQLNLEQLYKIHERQIMLLELKIQQLRDDIVNLTKDQTNQRASKGMIRRLTQEIKSYENSNIAKKLSQGRNLMLQKQLKQTKEKLSISQKARINLNLQVETLTKRLKIRDTQIQKINQEDLEKYQSQQLSSTQQQLFEDIKKLVKAVKDNERNSIQYLLRKISLLLADLSKSRDIILECNDFLVQLMQILDDKLSNKMPQIVLDCNKFIRSFLIQNLSIF